MKNLTRKFSIVSVIAYIILLIPVLLYSSYIHPFADDYSSSSVHDAFVNSGNIFSAAKEAAEITAETYNNWQGTFCANFINNLNPNNFSKSFYWITPFIMIGALTFAVVFFADTVFCKWLKLKRSYGVLVSMLLLISYVEFAPCKLETFYWFNGSSIYTLFYSFFLVMLSMIVRVIMSDKNNKTPYCIFGMIFAFLIGGGNYCTALVTIEIIITVLFLLLINKNSSFKYVLLIFISNLISFLINISAPGNNVRSDPQSRQLPVIAVIKAIFAGGIKMEKWTSFQQLAVFVIAVPVLYLAAKKCKWQFKHPLIVIIYTYLLYASQFAPNLYADSTTGPQRLLNIAFYFYYIIILFDIFYVLGWITKKYPKLINGNIIKNIFTKKNIFAVLLILLVGTFCGCYNYGITEMASVGTAVSIVEGTAKEYKEEFEVIDNYLEKSEDSDVVISDVQTIPKFLSGYSLKDDSSYWVNEKLSEYYHLKSIRTEN